MPALYLATGHSTGEEISSTYEGRHLTLEESYLTHPYHSDTFIDAGEPCYCGNIVGVCFNSAAAATDLMAIDTEGIWFLTCTAIDDNGNIAIAPGDPLYIGNTGLITKKVSGVPFGYALGDLATGTTGVVAVKVHWDPTVGNGIKFLAMSFVKSAMTDGGGTSGYIDFTTVLPIGAVVLGWKAITSVAFSGDTTATVSVGVSGDTDRFSADTTGSCFTTITIGSASLAADALDGIAATSTVRVTITSTADFTNVNVLGAMTVIVYYFTT